MHAPKSVVNSEVSSNRLELQLNFLAKQLDREHHRRSNLQMEVETMTKKLKEIEDEGKAEAN